MPEPYYMPETDRTNEYDYTVRGREPITNRPLWDPQTGKNEGGSVDEVRDPVVIPASTVVNPPAPATVPASQPMQQQPPPIDLPDDGPQVQPG